MSTTLLDVENFKINSNAWVVQDATGIVYGQHIPIKVKIHPEGDVREYVSGVPAEFIGQQLFTFTAALRETQKIGKSLPENYADLESIISAMPGDTDIQKYKNYLTKAAVKFSGCFSSGSHIFDDIGHWAYYRLDDGTRLALGPTTRNLARRDESMGYMISLDK